MVDVRISDLTAAPTSAVVDGSLLELSTGSGGSSFALSIGVLKAWFANTFAQVIGSGGAVPTMAGTAAVGSSAYAARADHTHPTDTSRAAMGANGDITGLSALTSLTCKGTGTFYGLAGGGQNANFGTNPPNIKNTGQFMFGWNMSGGNGETDLIVNRGAGSIGGFSVYDQNNSGVNTLLMSMTVSGGATFANPAATLAGLGGAAVSDLGINTQNILYQGLLIAALRNVPTGLVDGILDPFSSTADINTAKSSGYTFNSSAGTIGATQNTGTALQNTSYAIASSSISGYPAANAFDGNGSTIWGGGELGTGVSGVSHIGQDFGAGNAQAVASATITQGSAAAAQINSAILRYADSPSGPWTNVATVALNGAAQATVNVPSGTGAHRCWDWLANGNLGASNGWNVAEVTLTSPVSTSPIALQSATLPSAVASPSAMRALIQVDGTSAALVPNTDVVAALSRDGGATFTQGTLATVQAMPDGTTVLDTGWVSVAAQPAGNSTMTYRLTTPTQKAAVFTGISMQVKP